MTVSPVDPSVGRLHPVPLTGYALSSGFWGDWQQLNREAIIPHCEESLERVGWIENFRAAMRGTLATERVGRLFTDSEIYKTIEALAWENSREPSADLADRLLELTELVAAVQDDDGYLNTFYGYPGGPERYGDLQWGHELYCFGHLLQAAVAVLRSGGPEAFVTVARRAADHICDHFGPEGVPGLCGHPEVETALVELYRATGERRYLDQASLFIERRGHRTLGDTMFGGPDYYQDGVPVREAEVLVGHAVRALYLAAGAIDVAVETGDLELLERVRAAYDRTLQRRTYIHGGMGSNHHGESYGEDFELPSERAYAETCTAVASIHVAWRLLLATGEERYADVIERTLYNTVVAGPAHDGRSFFYVNTLHRRSLGVEPEPVGPSLRRTDGRRASWFTTSCCPTNLARLFASLGGYLATVDGDGVQLHQFAAGEVRVELPGGRQLRLRVETGYPVDGTVRVRVLESDDQPWTLGLRVPEWCRNASLQHPDSTLSAAAGLATVHRVWSPGDEVVLTLDLSPRWVVGDPRVDAVRSSVAVERGPLVYCAESCDQPDVDLDLVQADLSAGLKEEAGSGLFDGSVVITAAVSLRDVAEGPWPFRAVDGEAGADRAGGGQLALRLVPYYLWANREPSTMRVWLPVLDTSPSEGPVASVPAGQPVGVR